MFTHAYGDGERTGVRWLTSGLKVSSWPSPPAHTSTAVPAMRLAKDARSTPRDECLITKGRIEIMTAAMC